MITQRHAKRFFRSRYRWSGICCRSSVEPPERVLDCLARLEPTAPAIEIERHEALEGEPNGLVFTADEGVVL